jgi:hypothetical protein
MVTPNESMQQAVERLLMRIRLAQKMAHQVRCSAPVLWQSKAVHHAADGESIAAWAQVKVPAGERASLRVEQTTRPGQAPLSCPVLWDPAIELSRISAALRLRDMPEAQEREALAMAYQLVSSETNLILVHERAEADKAEDLPELHQVRPMLAAGWGGNGSVRHSHSAVLASLARPSYSRIESFESMDSRLFDSIEPFQPSRSGLNTPAVWRTPRTHAASRAGNSSAGMDDIEIPAFLRRQADDDTPDAPKPPKGPIAKLVDKIMPAPQAAAPAAPVQAARPAVAHKTPKAAPDELMAVLQNQSGKNTQVQEFVESFNQAARTHARFRSALAVCLRSKQGNFLHWLVTKHMQSAGSAAPVWAVFIAWASDKFRIPLTPEADKALRDFMPTVPSEVQAAIRGDLEALVLKN